MVTTPQPAAQKVAQRAGFMAQKVNLEVKGVIENMSWFTGDDGKRYELFGAGGGDDLADGSASRCSARCRSSSLAPDGFDRVARRRGGVQGFGERERRRRS